MLPPAPTAIPSAPWDPPNCPSPVPVLPHLVRKPNAAADVGMASTSTATTVRPAMIRAGLAFRFTELPFRTSPVRRAASQTLRPQASGVCRRPGRPKLKRCSGVSDSMCAMGRGQLVACITLVAALAAPAAATAQVQPKVVGGDPTPIADYPWQAALVFDSAKRPGNAFQRQFCGGSLVTASIVVTAAHCVFDTDPDDGSALDPDDVDVVLGQSNLATAPSTSALPVQSVTYEPGFEPSYGPGDGDVPQNDVAYLVLSAPYEATTPIDIAGPDEDDLWDPDSEEQITGWGATAESGPGSNGSSILRVATVPIVSDFACSADYGEYFDS